MASYKISEAAKIDLIRIHQYGVIHFGEDQAGKYFNAFFEHFDKIAEQPFLYPAVDFIRPGYRRCVLGVDSIYFLVKDGSVEIIRIIGRQNFEG